MSGVDINPVAINGGGAGASIGTGEGITVGVGFLTKNTMKNITVTKRAAMLIISDNICILIYNMGAIILLVILIVLLFLLSKNEGLVGKNVSFGEDDSDDEITMRVLGPRDGRTWRELGRYENVFAPRRHNGAFDITWALDNPNDSERVAQSKCRRVMSDLQNRRQDSWLYSDYVTMIYSSDNGVRTCGFHLREFEPEDVMDKEGAYALIMDFR